MNLTGHPNSRSYLPPDAHTIAKAFRIATVVPLASRVVLQGLHVEMRRGHAVIAALVPKTVTPGTAFEDVAARGISSWEDGHPELRVLQLRDCN